MLSDWPLVDNYNPNMAGIPQTLPVPPLVNEMTMLNAIRLAAGGGTSGSGNITGGGTIATGGFTLTVPATGTAALLGIEQTFTARQTISVNGAASAPAFSLTGTMFSGGSATTTKPLCLIEPAGTTSSGWSVDGTLLGINAPTGAVSWRYISCQLDGVNKFYVRKDGLIHTAFGLECDSFYSTFGGVAGNLAFSFGVWGFQVNSLYLSGPMAYNSVQNLSGAGAVNITTLVTKVTTTGVAQALTLGDASVDGHIKVIEHNVDGGSFVLTPTTKTGFTTITSSNAGDTVTLKWSTTVGWIVLSSFGVLIA
jgi:hypothetical protein